MAQLQDIVVGSIVTDLAGDQPVEVIVANKRGERALSIVYQKADGQVVPCLLYQEDAEKLEIQSDNLPWSFDADGGLMQLVSEAYRIQQAYLFDPYLAVHTSSIEPLPHQIEAVYGRMLPRIPLRYVLADDPGAGKTIMTGLFLKELMMRGDLQRCLIVCPGSLCEQWQEELYTKFHLRFDILSNDSIENAVTGNVFREKTHCIARLDKLARDAELHEKLKDSEWDLVVVDEAHKMSASIWGKKVHQTKRYQLGKLLSGKARHFLLLTATPHNGKEQEFQLFLSLLDPDRFEGAARNGQSIDTSDIMRRMVKEDLLKFDGTPLFPERYSYTVNYSLTGPEKELYEAVTAYVKEEFNRAERLADKAHCNSVGFALTILQRRAASSPEAIYQSLFRRRERLEKRVEEVRKTGRFNNPSLPDIDDLDDDDLTPEEEEALEAAIADQASAAQDIPELLAEIDTLKRLEEMANRVRNSGVDRKWSELSTLLQDGRQMLDSEGKQEKLIIFTEHRDTLNYLDKKLKTLFGSDDAVVTIHGNMRRDKRRDIEARFKQDKEVRILIATDAAGEGINLQRAHLMINYDLPWNPNRLEQRFGRIHRIGQTDKCYLWNLVAGETREGAVFERLFHKLEQERMALGGKVFDILGKLTFNDCPLKDLLLEAIRNGDADGGMAHVVDAVDAAMTRERLQELIRQYALTEDVLKPEQVIEIRENMERMEAHKLQPLFIQAFFRKAFTHLGGRFRPREDSRLEITFTPMCLRGQKTTGKLGVQRSYERICFDKKYCNMAGLPVADLVCPGHPLLDAIIAEIRERHADVLKRGTILVDESDYGTEARLMISVEDVVQNPHGPVSRRLLYVEQKQDGSTSKAGYAPYLDYRPCTEAEREVLTDYIRRQDWLTRDVEVGATLFAIEHLTPKHLEDIKLLKEAICKKTRKAVRARLTSEIQYWDAKANEYKAQLEAGNPNARLNMENAAKQADELDTRLKIRLEQLDKESQLSALPPVIMGGAIIIPKGLLHQLTGNPLSMQVEVDRKSLEYAAMAAVMRIEKSLGYQPKDVSKENCGYDVESYIPADKRGNGNSLRFIEVKGRRAGAETVTVSYNEVMTALNAPNQYILAIVEVDGATTYTTYLCNPFLNPLDEAVASTNYKIDHLKRNATILLEQTL